MLLSLQTPSGYTLSGLQAEDAEALAALLGEGSVSAFIPAIPHPYTLGEARSFIAHRIKWRLATGREITFAIHEPTGRMIGSVGVDDYPVGEAKSAELGFWLGSSHRGRRVMSEVLPVFIAYAFRELNLESLTASTLSFNAPSQALLNRMRFRHLRTEPAFTRTRDGLFDTLFYVLPRASFEAGSVSYER